MRVPKREESYAGVRVRGIIERLKPLTEHIDVIEVIDAIDSVDGAEAVQRQSTEAEYRGRVQRQSTGAEYRGRLQGQSTEMVLRYCTRQCCLS